MTEIEITLRITIQPRSATNDQGLGVGGIGRDLRQIVEAEAKVGLGIKDGIDILSVELVV